MRRPLSKYGTLSAVILCFNQAHYLKEGAKEGGFYPKGLNGNIKST